MQERTKKEISHRFAKEALSWVGTSFIHKGRRKETGVDCLGLVLGSMENVLGQRNYKIPDYSPAFHRTSHEGLNINFLEEFLLVKFDQPLSGDILLFELCRNRLLHLGIFLDQKCFIHSHFRRGVEVMMFNKYWRDRWARTYRLKEV